jgi:hypothetical protein
MQQNHPVVGITASAEIPGMANSMGIERDCHARDEDEERAPEIGEGYVPPPIALFRAYAVMFRPYGLFGNCWQARGIGPIRHDTNAFESDPDIAA